MCFTAKNFGYLITVTTVITLNNYTFLSRKPKKVVFCVYYFVISAFLEKQHRNKLKEKKNIRGAFKRI